MRYPISPVILVTLAGSCISNTAAQPDAPFPAVFELSSLLPANGGTGGDGFVVYGSAVYDGSGGSVSSAGDINGDGIDDLVIGAFHASPNGNQFAGESYVIFGGESVGSLGVIELSSLNGMNGFVLRGFDFRDRSGNSVSSAGDINGDGIDDLIIGASHASANGTAYAGESYVVFGGEFVGSSGVIELASLDGTDGFAVRGIDSYDYSGNSVSSAGDVNGDGVDDLIIGAYKADANGNANAGESYVVFGEAGVGSSGALNLSSLNGTNGFVINGDDSGDWSGYSVSSAGDVNGDGLDDLIIGARNAWPSNRPGAGESYVVFGGVGVGSSGAMELGLLNGMNGILIAGIDQGDFCGQSVSSAGDVNNDAFSDLIIGASNGDPNGNSDAGESFVVFGGADIGSGVLVEASSLNGSNGFVLNGIDVYDSSGSSVSSAGDVNGDGIDDMLIGAVRGEPNGYSFAGESYVVFGDVGVGSSGSIELSSLNGTDGFVLNGIDLGDTSGSSVSSAGDVNGDGVDDLIIGAPNASPNGNYSGESYVVFGRNLSPCIADTNGDGTLSPTDFTAWINAFNNNLSECDQNGDGSCTPTDFTAWIANYNAGCS